MSTLKVDTLTASDGSSAVTLTKQSAAKAWINFDGTSTGAVGDYDRGAFNCAVTVDNGNGNFTIGFVNNMNNANYSGVSGGHTSNDNVTNSQHTFVTEFATSTFRIICNNSASTADNWTLTTAIIHGDLA